MRLITKVNLALFGVVAVSAVLNFATLRLLVMPSFSALEQEAAKRNQSRVLEAIDLQKDQVANSAGDYAIWDDTHDFMNGNGPDYEEKNVTPESLKTLGVNFFLALDEAGKVVLDRGYDFTGDEPRPLTLLSDGRLPIDGPLFERADTIEIRSALMQSPEGLVVVGYAPILRSDRSGARAGTLVLGRLLDAEALRTATRVDFDLLPGAAPAPVAGGEGGTLDVSDRLAGLDGKPISTVVSHTARDITAVGRKTVLTTMMFLLATAGVLLLCLGLLLRGIVLRRIETLRSHLVGVGVTGDLQPIMPDGQKDELSETLQSFNEMARQLGELRDRVRRQDYAHGAADQAAGLLHNVRNAISPVSVLAWDLSQAGDAPWKQNLLKAVEQLGAPEVPPDRAAKLQQFVAMSASRLIEEDRKRQEDVGSMVTMLRHIDDILKEQDRSAQRERVIDVIDVAAALRNALPQIERRDGLRIETGSLEGLEVLGHKVPLEQVIGNLIVNAAEAVEASAGGTGLIRIACRKTVSTDGAPGVEITVADDGVGIDPNNLVSLFEKGYSTKVGGTRGLGLHWCANAVNAMGGRLTASSDGPGKGAMFKVVLPASQSMREAA
nr:CHASE4 domain [uncultured organism]